MTDTITEYLRNLMESTAEAETHALSEASRRRQEEAEQFAQGGVSLPDRLKRVIAAIPASEREQSRPLEFFAERLRGRKSMSPHRGELAGALRLLGWTRKRCWHESEAGFRAHWHPPVHD